MGLFIHLILIFVFWVGVVVVAGIQETELELVPCVDDNGNKFVDELCESHAFTNPYSKPVMLFSVLALPVSMLALFLLRDEE